MTPGVTNPGRAKVLWVRVVQRRGDGRHQRPCPLGPRAERRRWPTNVNIARSARDSGSAWIVLGTPSSTETHLCLWPDGGNPHVRSGGGGQETESYGYRACLLPNHPLPYHSGKEGWRTAFNFYELPDNLLGHRHP